MKTHRVWVEIVILSTMIACVLALLIATLGVAVGALGTKQASNLHLDSPVLTRVVGRCARVAGAIGLRFSKVSSLSASQHGGKPASTRRGTVLHPMLEQNFLDAGENCANLWRFPISRSWFHKGEGRNAASGTLLAAVSPT